MTSKEINADEIRRQMARIRKELHEDVQGVIRSADAATNWRKMIAARPWAWLGGSFGGAFLLGSLLIPRRKEPVPPPTFVATPWWAKSVERPEPEKQREDEKEAKAGSWGALGAILGMVAPVAVRAAQGYAANALEQWLEQVQPAPGTRTPAQPSARPGPAPGPWTKP